MAEQSNPRQTDPAYRTPDCRRPVALMPLNTGKSSKLAQFQAALGIGPTDPWKPKALPGIVEQDLTPRRSDSLLERKPLSIPRLSTSMKPAVLPGIGERPLQRSYLSGITRDKTF